MRVRIYNNTLNPSLWTPALELDEKIRQKLIQIARDFYVNTKLVAPIEDIYLLGSSANYNWSPKSDIDLHILIDFKKLSPDENLVKILVDQLKANWNKKHDIRIKNNKVEIYLQNISETNRSTGVFSLLQNKWILKPNKQKIVLDRGLIQNKYTTVAKQIKSAIASGNLDYMNKVQKYIYDLRETGLSKVGEFSVENIVFKVLRNRQYIDMLRDAITKVYDSNASVKEISRV
jgi:hypothetical protein